MNESPFVKNDRCTFEDCCDARYKKGYCKQHGRMLGIVKPIPENAPLCTHGQCQEPIEYKKVRLCARHYYKMRCHEGLIKHKSEQASSYYKPHFTFEHYTTGEFI